MKIILPLLPLLLLTACQTPEEAPAKRPNVLFILADDMGYTDLSVMGSTYYETPNLDRIANEGMIFTNGYAASRVCSPSRASIMTGKFTARHGITDWIGARSGEDWRKANRHDKLLPAEYIHNLPASDVALGEAMKEAGYKTFFAGKWHLGSEGSYPEDHGFDINVGGWDKGSPIGGYFDPYENPKLPNREPGENLSMRLARETADFLQANKDTSFFAFLSFYAVHGPIQTTKEKWEKYRKKALQKEVPENGFEMERVLPIRKTQDNPVYAGLVEAMDEAIGLVLQTLDELGLDEETIVIFTSDNGGVASGDSYSTSNLPLRGGKGYQWEGGIREPYFIKVPGMVPAGSKTEVRVTGADFYPTLLELVGAPLKPEQHVDGLSLVPVLKGGELPARPLYWHYPHYGNQGGNPSSIIIEGDWKLIHYYEDYGDELYNIKTDIREGNNVAKDHPEITQRLLRQLNDWLSEVGAKMPSADPQYDATLAQERKEQIINEQWPRLEQRRKDYLREDWQPNEDWWGSMITMD